MTNSDDRKTRQPLFAALLLTLGLMACGDRTPTETAPRDVVQNTQAASTTPTTPSVNETATEATANVDITVIGLPDNRVRFEGTIIGADETSFPLKIESAHAEGDFIRDVRIFMTEDGSFTSETFDLSGGSENGIYRASLWVPLTPVNSYAYGWQGENAFIGGLSEMVKPHESEAVPEGQMLVELNFGVGGESAEPMYAAWEERQLQRYRQWLTDLEELHTRLEAQYERRGNPADWTAFSEAFRADLSSRQQ